MSKGHTIWIIGGGHYGLLAARRWAAWRTKGAIRVIDHSTEACRQVEQEGFATVCSEGVSYLQKYLKAPGYPDWIIPVIPRHVAYEWVRLKLAPTQFVVPVVVPEKLLQRLPNPLPGGEGKVYMSNADFVCPDNCGESGRTCLFTGRPRPRILHAHLRALEYPGFQFIVIQSHQLLPGVGGYRPAALFRALDAASRARSTTALCTACSCHGVLDAFQTRRQPIL